MCSPALDTGRSAPSRDYYLSCARASLRAVVSSGRPSARPSACSHQFRSAWRPPVICSPILLRRSGEQITSVRPAPLKLLRSVFYPFASLRFFVSLRSSASCRSASSCALADSVRPALVPRSARTESAVAPAFASLHEGVSGRARRCRLGPLPLPSGD